MLITVIHWRPMGASEWQSPARVVLFRRAPGRLEVSIVVIEQESIPELFSFIWRRLWIRKLKTPGDLERKIEQAARIASRIGGQTTVDRLSAWIQDLRQMLQQRLEARRALHGRNRRPGDMSAPKALFQFSGVSPQ